MFTNARVFLRVREENETESTYHIYFNESVESPRMEKIPLTTDFTESHPLRNNSKVAMVYSRPHILLK